MSRRYSSYSGSQDTLDILVSLVPSSQDPPGKPSSLLHELVTNLTMAIAITIAKNSQDPRLWLTDSCESLLCPSPEIVTVIQYAPMLLSRWYILGCRDPPTRRRC